MNASDGGGKRVVQLLLLAVAVWGVTYARFALGPLQEAMRLNLLLSDNAMAWLQGAALAVPMALGAIPFGILVDRCSRARLFPLFTSMSLVATALSAWAPSLAVLFAARAVAGLALAAVLVSAYSIVADLYPPAQRGRATMLVAVGEIAGAPAAFALGGMLLTMHARGPEDWRTALLWMSTALVPVVVLMFAVREPARTGLVVRSPALRDVWFELWQFRGVLVPLFLARTMVWVSDGAVLTWAAPAFARRYKLPSDRIGAMLGLILLISGLLGPVLGGPVADLCQRTGGPRRTAAALGLLALLCVPASFFAIMPSATSASWLLGALLTLGYTIGTAAITLGTIVIPGEVRGLYLALTITLAAFFFIGLAPLAVSGLAGELGGPEKINAALAVVCTTTSILGAAIFFFTRRYFPMPVRSGTMIQSAS